MDQGNGGVELGGLGIWLFLAALVIASAWKAIRRDAEKHETLRRIVEKTGTVDEAQLRVLFRPAAPQEPVKATPGAGYRILRVLGTLIMGGAAALLSSLVVGILLGLNEGTGKGVLGGFVVATTIGVFGLGVFLSARFATPPDRENGPTAR
jgi:hypothetical protein